MKRQREHAKGRKELARLKSRADERKVGVGRYNAFCSEKKKSRSTGEKRKSRIKGTKTVNGIKG